jgi:hypothetical protein
MRIARHLSFQAQWLLGFPHPHPLPGFVAKSDPAVSLMQALRALAANKMFFTEKDHAIAKKLASLPR